MRHFSARETAWLQELDGIELASFRRRAIAFLLDWTIVGVTMLIVSALGGLMIFGIARAIGHPIHVSNLDLDKAKISISDDGPVIQPKASGSHLVYKNSLDDLEDKKPHTMTERVLGEVGKITSSVIVPLLYFGILLWRGKGQTPGKRWMKIRVVSIVHPHLSFWHSVERALGYGAAALEAGFGYFQFWIHPYRRCAQDRLAETIVVTESAYQKMLVTRGSVKS